MHQSCWFQDRELRTHQDLTRLTFKSNSIKKIFQYQIPSRPPGKHPPPPSPTALLVQFLIIQGCLIFTVCKQVYRRTLICHSISGFKCKVQLPEIEPAPGGWINTLRQQGSGGICSFLKYFTQFRHLSRIIPTLYLIQPLIKYWVRYLIIIQCTIIQQTGNCVMQ